MGGLDEDAFLRVEMKDRRGKLDMAPYGLSLVCIYIILTCLTMLHFWMCCISILDC